MGRITQLDVVTSVLIAFVATAVASYALATERYPPYAYVLSFVVTPISVALLTIYLLLRGQILKGRIKSYAIFACGMLLTGFSLALVVEFGAIALIILLTGFILILIGMRRTWA